MGQIANAYGTDCQRLWDRLPTPMGQIANACGTDCQRLWAKIDVADKINW